MESGWPPLCSVLLAGISGDVRQGEKQPFPERAATVRSVEVQVLPGA